MHRQGGPWSSTEGTEGLLCEAGDQNERPGEKRSSQSHGCLTCYHGGSPPCQTVKATSEKATFENTECI